LNSIKKDVYREIIKYLMKNPKVSKKDLNKTKILMVKRYGLTKIPSNSELISRLKPHERNRLLPILRLKEVRTISGVAVVATVTKPHSCPHGKCAYCPGGPQYNLPSAYVGKEPAIMRGIENQFSPYLQVKNRIQQLQTIGHIVDKVEIIVMGGTFPSMHQTYQEHFIQECLNALTETKTQSLEDAKKAAETSKKRNVGITVETRPDWAQTQQVDQMLKMGVTRVELGVQTTYDDIYQRVDRGHTIKDVVEATRILKDSGLKVTYHLMPGLPGSNPERDLNTFRSIFNKEEFKPDMLKIYPCLVIKGTKVYEWWKRGEFKPYTSEEAICLLQEVKKIVPPWIRIMRIQRDIPASLIVAGVKKSNLRQLIQWRLEENGEKCRCIRCREVGHHWLKKRERPSPKDIEVKISKENASEGIEIFISAEDQANDILIGYLRLRIPSEKAHRPEIDHNVTSIVRELHIYGPMVPLGEKTSMAWQHEGYGSTLLSRSEQISREEYDRKKITITSALGTKEYYLQQGYRRDGPYVSKSLVG